MTRHRHQLECDTCGKSTRTVKAGTSTCLPCAARGHWPAMTSKKDLDVLLRVQDRMGWTA